MPGEFRAGAAPIPEELGALSDVAGHHARQTEHRPIVEIDEKARRQIGERDLVGRHRPPWRGRRRLARSGGGFDLAFGLAAGCALYHRRGIARRCGLGADIAELNQTFIGARHIGGHKDGHHAGRAKQFAGQDPLFSRVRKGMRCARRHARPVEVRVTGAAAPGLPHHAASERHSGLLEPRTTTIGSGQ